MMLAVFFAMASMMFSMTLYASAIYPAQAGGAHALGPLAPICQWLAFAFAVPVLALLGWPLVADNLGLSRARIAGGSGARWVNALISVGVLASFGLSVANLARGEGEVYFETAIVILVLVTLGRYLDARARHRATRSMRDLLGIDAEWAFRLDAARSDGNPTRIPLAEARPGDRLRVLAGERVPADGEVVAGSGAVDEAVLTGETGPRSLAPGGWINAGAVLADGCVEMIVRRAAGDRLLDRMAEIVDSARERRMPLERLSEAVSRWFLLFSVLAAAATVVYWNSREGWGPAMLNGLAVLLIACPCALGIATPLAAWTGTGRAARRGILVRGADVFEKLARGGTIFFDKTGTLTSSRLEVSRVTASAGAKEEEVLCAAASLASLSRHPASEAIRRAAEAGKLELAQVKGLKVLSGLGLLGEVGGERVSLGSQRFVGGNSAFVSNAPAVASETPVFVARGDRLLGAVCCREELRSEAREVVQSVTRQGYEAAVLTGDTAEKGEHLEAVLGIPVAAGLLPADKVARLEGAKRSGRTVVMVGDGVNDAPVLAAADVGVAMQGGADLARETADVVLLDRDGEPLRGLLHLLELSRQTVRRIRFNLFWSFGYNALGMALAAAGLIHPVTAAVLMIASSLFVVAGSRL